MKRIYTLFLLVFSTALLKAQPALNNLGVPVAGSTINTYEATLDSINPGEAGADRVWDFSYITDYPDTNIFSFEDASTPFPSSFPDANFVTSSSQFYYKFTNIEDVYYGYIGIDNSSNYTNPQTSIKVPLAYNETYNDTFSGTASTTGSTAKISGTTSATYDGYGTLITKNGVYNNVIRLKLVKTEVDSTDYYGGNSMITEWKYTSYQYFYPGEFVPIFLLLKAEFISDDTTGFIPSTARIYDQTPRLLANHHSENFQVSAFPNPATDRITLSGLKKGDYAAAIYTETGEKVMESNFRASGSYAMNVSDLPKGIYILQVLSNEGASRTKIVKE